MQLDFFLREVVLMLTAAVVIVIVSGRLRVPPIVAFLGTGVLIGPSGLGWISQVEEVELFAEVGVALLLFTIGLEVSMERLRRLRRTLLMGGPIQVVLTTVVVTGTGLMMDLSWQRALFLGWVVSLSSTALVLKLLADRREVEAPHGQIALGILLFQDFLIVPFVALTPLLGGAIGGSWAMVVARLLGAAVALFLVFLLARRLLPGLMEVVVHSKSREVLPLGALALSLGMGWLTHSFGFSLALGSFLAGVLLSGSQYSHQVVADVAPFRDLFSGIFFISIGMLLDLQWVFENPLLVIATTVGVVLLKILAAGAAARALGYPWRTVALSAMALAQIGEFSFVLIEVGSSSGLLSEAGFQLFLASSVVTLLATPLIVALSYPLSLKLSEMLPAGSPRLADEPTGEKPLTDHVIVVGYGTGGRLLARVLREAGIPYLVVELSSELIRRGRHEGEPMLYGDATREEILHAAGVERANIVVFAVSDLTAVMVGTSLCRRLAPSLLILVRTRLVREIDQLHEAGADQVVAEEFETAIEMFTRVLQRYHVPRNIIRAQTRVLRGEGYKMLRSTSLDQTVSLAVLDALAAGATDIYLLKSESDVVGRSLRDLNLRQASGATVIALVRDGLPQSNPGPDVSLAGGDCLVLMGSHEEVDRAFDLLARLEQSPDEPAPVQPDFG